MLRVVTGGLSLLLVVAQVTPVMAQPTPVQPGGPQVQPTRPRPEIQPPRPLVQPPRPPRPEIQPPPPPRPEIQPPRPPRPPYPEIQPPRPVRPRPPYPPQIIQPPRPVYGNLRCESYNYAYKLCPVATRGGVQLARRIAGQCREGYSWGYNRRAVWVHHGCRADFRIGYGGGVPDRPYPDRDDNRGPSTGAVIAGVAVAGGLIALLASNANKKRQANEAANATPPSYSPGPPAALRADLSRLPSASRTSVQTCLSDAARQIGATGGSRVEFDKPESLEAGNGGWRLRTTLIATYPDGDRDVPVYCRATPTKVIELTFG